MIEEGWVCKVAVCRVRGSKLEVVLNLFEEDSKPRKVEFPFPTNGEPRPVTILRAVFDVAQPRELVGQWVTVFIGGGGAVVSIGKPTGMRLTRPPSWRRADDAPRSYL